MLAEEYNTKIKLDSLPKFSIKGDQLVSFIVLTFVKTVEYFRGCLQNGYLKDLNENEYTQILVEQIDIQLRKFDLPIGVKNQYYDIKHGSSGISDFYFHPLEEGSHKGSIFSVEAKRLPSPTRKREREYVIGTRKNGGIERYKLEIHGKGLNDCGIIGYVEEKDFKDWKYIINSWIIELAYSSIEWTKSELLTGLEINEDFAYLNSKSLRNNSSEINLHHFWIRT